jgi:hypothetical protein
MTGPRASGAARSVLQASGSGCHRARRDLPFKGLVGAEKQLLARLTAGVERPGDLHAAEGARVEQAAVIAGERDALRDALVDDLRRDLGEPVDVRLPRLIVAALDSVVEQPLDGVPVVAVVLSRVDAALSCDAVGAAGAVLIAERRDLVAASPGVAEAEPPASPVPTTIAERFCRLAG